MPHYYSSESSESESDSGSDRSPSPPVKRRKQSKAAPKERIIEKHYYAPPAEEKPKRKVRAPRQPNKDSAGNYLIYCNRCKSKNGVVNAKQETSRNAQPRIVGNCAKCGGKVHGFVPLPK